MEGDGHIRLLPIHVANKIAAGEVVERPASVVKELLENAIDAGATRIEVEVTAGGRTLVAVHDDGCGMGRDDALLSLERQATSKIRDVDDIERIDTLGFRGEAVPSIASVSRFLLRTRRAQDAVGTEIAVVGGKILEVKDAGGPAGTSVEVRDLFFNVPARRKFLRAYATEQARIRTVFLVHALAHPGLGLTLKADGREIHRLPPGATLEERIGELLGLDVMAAMRPVDGTVAGVRVHGFVGLPALARMDRSEQYVFVNKRPATAPVIGYAISAAYPKLEAEARPVVVLSVDRPPDQVEVNVQPTKREVRFRRPGDVRDAVFQAVSAAFGCSTTPATEPNPPVMPPSADLRHLVSFAAARPQPVQHDLPVPGRQPAPPLVDASAAAAVMPGACAPFDYASVAGGPVAPGPEAAAAAGMDAPVDDAPWRWFRVMGQVGGRYALLETDTGYVTLDPVAAYERVVYEALLRRQDGAAAVSQQLLLPETVQLPPRDAARLRDYLDVVQALGFGVGEFGGDCFVVDALPAVLADAPCRGLLVGLAQDLEQTGVQRGTGRWREEAVARAACRAAAGTGRNLDDAAIEALVRELAATRMPYTCPRGRPTMVLTTWRELARRFGRS